MEITWHVHLTHTSSSNTSTMAAINEPAVRPRKSRGVKRTKKKSTHIDLTPMVDLGFLLITFFIFTTSLSRPTAIRLIMPKDGPPMLTPESGTLSILLGDGSMVYYYAGSQVSGLQKTTLAGIRAVIVDKKKRTANTDLMVILKPGKDASFKNVIALLDEMRINEIRHYALVDITRPESDMIARH